MLPFRVIHIKETIPKVPQPIGSKQDNPGLHEFSPDTPSEHNIFFHPWLGGQGPHMGTNSNMS